ncbi:kinesin KIF20B isoform X1 [Brachionus plicatilis]|uniref:Kinesin KIF20B isoform X1 n=1 Tax=Brachionus plicatilis TaxID=10195 RepID=A0A3M7Q7D3_BRAPC|nr:kinesin KIF20B isoform X1 [Brachionus plicatilis]
MESSYCYLASNGKEAESINETTDLETTQDTSEKSRFDSSSDGTSESKIDHVEESLNNTTSIHDLKKNLYNEEEFRSINHSEPIHIFLKLKPLTDQEMAKQNNIKHYKIHSDTAISLIPPKYSVYCQNKQSLQNLSNTLYSFSYVFQPDISQQDFFKATIFPCLEKFFNGENLLIFSYGVTNSGKTFTMQGTNKNAGLIPRTLDVLFDTLKNNLETKRAAYSYKPEKFNEISSLTEAELNSELNIKEQILKLSNYKEIDRTDSFGSLNDLEDASGSLMSTKKFGSLDSISSYCSSASNLLELDSRIKISENKRYALWLCFYELYNDNVYDLLTIPTKSKMSLANNERPQLKIREDMNRVPYVEGLNHIPVFDTKEAIKVLKYGEKNLQKSSNSINATSSRSHATFCLKLVTIENNTINKGATIYINQLSFCDLAGIERSSKTNAVGITQKEASCINTSLMSLSRCIETMMQNQKNSKGAQLQVPYRVNKLTRLFQAYFEGRGMVKMIVNLNPSVNFFDENVNVLKFSSIANQIQIGLNDEEKIHYKVEPEKVEQNDRQSVAWESDQNKTKHVSDSEDDSEEESEEEEDSEEESGEEETEIEETCQESDEDTEEEIEESEEGSQDEEEEEETEEETEIEESATKSKLQKTSSTVNETTVEEESEDESDDETIEETDEETEVEETEIEETEMTVETTTNTTTSTTNITLNHSKMRKAESTRINAKTPKSVVQSGKKGDQTTAQNSIIESDLSTLLNETSMAIVKNTADMSKLQSWSNTELYQIIENLRAYIIKTRRDATKFEAELRNQLVTKWSRKVEETESYFQKEMENYKLRIDSDLAERINFIEQVNERKSKVKLEETKKNYDAILAENEEKFKKLNCQIDKLNEELSSKIWSSGPNDRSIKRKLSHCGYDESQVNVDANMMEFDDDLQIKEFNKNQSMQIQTSILSAGINTSMQTEIVKKKSIGIDADNEFFDQMHNYKKDLSMMNHEYESLNHEMDLKSNENENLRNELKKQLDNFRQLESESRQIQSELMSQLKMAEVNSKNLQSLLNEKEDLLSESSQQIVKLKEKISLFEAEVNENFKTLEDLDSKFLKLKSDSETEKKSLRDKSEEYRSELEAKKLAFERLEESKVQLQAEIDELKQIIEEKNTEIEVLKNDVQFKDNKIERLMFDAQQQKEQETIIQQYQAQVAKLEAENAAINCQSETASLPPIFHSKKPLKQDLMEMAVDCEPPKMKKSKSGTSLKKMSKSGSKLSILSENGDSGELGKKKTLVSKTKKKHSVDESSESHKDKKKDKDSSKKTKKSVDAQNSNDESQKESKNKASKKSIEVDDVMETDEASEVSKVSKTKKKSTLDRITEMITKSPILEPLRNRPTRQVNLKASSSNASELSTCSISSNNSKKTKPNAKSSNLIETLNKIKDDNDENLNPEIDEKPKKVLRKKRAI